MELKDIKKVYFVGIGGIGMSALARYFNGRGVEVHGYDRTETTLTKKLVSEGMNIHYQEEVSAIPDKIDLVVYTPAIPDTHAELQFFRTNGFPLEKRAAVLGIISRSMKTIAVAGTHGKTSTSTMVTHLLKVGGVDCTSFLGGIAINFVSNFVEGTSDWVVAEADEFDRSFLHLSPDLAIITSMDADHLDIYGDRESLHETGFRAFVKKIKTGGRLWVQRDWVGIVDDLMEVESYGAEEGQFRAEQIHVAEGYFVFDYISPEIAIKGLKLSMAGKHNVENATAAITIALHLGVSPKAIREGLLSFKGIRRRFEFIYRNEQVAFIDDYAHHPSELNAAINAAKQLYPGKKITGIFQPHLYSRTRDFYDGFAAALDQLDEVLLLDIYPARELPIEGVNSAGIKAKMKNESVRLVEKATLMKELKKTTFDVLLTLGAGDINTFVEPIKDYLQNKKLN